MEYPMQTVSFEGDFSTISHQIMQAQDAQDAVQTVPSSVESEQYEVFEMISRITSLLDHANRTIRLTLRDEKTNGEVTIVGELHFGVSPTVATNNPVEANTDAPVVVKEEVEDDDFGGRAK